jgi:hypothetical protein
MPGSKRWPSLALVVLGLVSACGSDDEPASNAQAAGTSGVAGAGLAGGAFASSGSGGRSGAGSVDASDGGKAQAEAGAGSGLSSNGGDGAAPSSGNGGEPPGVAGGPDSDPSCPAQPTTFQLPCEDVVALWAPTYVFDSSQWLLDASAVELPLQSGTLTFFNSYSTSDFPVCGAVAIEVLESQLLATPTMDSHYLIASQIARFEVSDVCGNRYVYEPSGLACGSIVANEASSWLGGCAKDCPGACE